MIVCHCFAVNDRRLGACIDSGARTLKQISRCCSAGKDCGGCVPLILEIMSTRTKSYTTLADPDGLKTTFSGDTSDHTYVPADFNGAEVLSGGIFTLPRSVTVTRASVANAYSVNPIVVTGTLSGAVVTESIAQPNDDGNDTLIGTKLYDHITSIFIPANALGTSSFTLGVRDVGAPAGSRFAGIRAHAAGTVNVRFGEDATSATDGIPYAAGDLRFDPVQATRVVGSTSIGVTVYL